MSTDGFLEMLKTTAAELAAGDPALQQVADEESTRMVVAHELQDVLQASIGGSSMDAISASTLAVRSGLSVEEIYGLAHADRRVPLMVTSVRRVVEAAGYNFQVTGALASGALAGGSLSAGSLSA